MATESEERKIGIENREKEKNVNEERNSIITYKIYMSENISNESLNVCTKENLKSLVDHKLYRIIGSSSHQFFISLQ